MPKIKPRGNNELNSKFAFVQREYYEESVDKLLKENPKLSLIDLQKKTLYGKVNLNNEVVAPRLESMTTFQGRLQTFSFISDALSDLSDRINTRLNNGTMRRKGPYADLQIGNQGGNWRNEYVSYLRQMQESYMTRFMDTPAKKNKIKNFKQFLISFLDFAAGANPGYPLSFARHYTSRHSSILATGLSFEISTEKYGDDYTSYTEYFEDVNFDFFAQEAQNHGFIIDRHAPYRLVANLTSRPMRKYMQKNGILNASSMFEKLFFNPLQAEFFEIVKMISYMYSEAYPPGSTYAEICYKDGKTSYSLKEREIFRPQDFDSLEDMISYLGINTWLRAFCFIKAREANVDLSQREFDDIVEKATNLNKSLDIDAALGYISDKFNPLFLSDFDQKPTFRF